MSALRDQTDSLAIFAKIDYIVFTDKSNSIVTETANARPFDFKALKNPVFHAFSAEILEYLHGLFLVSFMSVDIRFGVC